MDFLGSVNVFHGRVQNGLATVGDLEVPFPDYTHSEPQAATLFIRPHELDIDREPHGENSLFARILRINRSGSLVKIALQSADGKPVDVELNHERVRHLNLDVEDEVWVYPRQVRVFLNENGVSSRGSSNGKSHAVAA
jgi:sulfate transport system ATP-binding protein